MTVMTESKMLRDSYVVLSRQTSANSTGIGDTSAQAAVLRYVGGSTVASSSEGTAKLDVCDRIGFMIGWCCTALSTGTRYVRVSAGDNWQGDLGNVDIELTPTSSGSTAATVTKIAAGPFESAWFGIEATSTAAGVEIGQNYIKFTVISDASSDAHAQYVNIVPFRWPGVSYAT